MAEMAFESEHDTRDRQFVKGALQVAQGATWFGLGIVIGSALEYLTQGLLAIHLGPDDFGVFNLGLRVTGIATALAIVSMPSALSFFIPRLRAQGDTQQVHRLISFSIWFTLLIGILIGAGLFLAAEPLATRVLDEPDLTAVLQLFAVTLPAAVMVAVMVGNMRGLKRSREASLLSSTYERALRLAFIVVLFALGFGVTAPVLAYLPASLAVALLGFYQLRRQGFHFSFVRPSGTMPQQLLHYTWPLLASQLLTQTIPSIQPLLLGYFHDARAVGLYSVSWLIAPRLFAMVLASFGFLYVPVISELISAGDKQSMRRLYRLVAKWQLIVVLPSYLLMLSLPDEFLRLFGSEYNEASSALMLMATSLLVSLSFGPVGATLLATGHTASYLVLNVAGTLIGVATGLLLIPPLGLIGAAVAHLLTNAGWNGLTWLVVYRRYGIHPFGRQYLLVCLTALAIWAPLYPVLRPLTSLTPWVVVAAIPVYSGLFVLILVKLHLLDSDSQKIVERFARMLLERAGDAQGQVREKVREVLTNRSAHG